MHNRKQTPNSNSFVRSEKSTFLGEKTPTSVLSSLRATPISARTVSLSQKNSSHIYSREKQPNCQQGKRSFHNHHHHHIRFWYLRCCGCPGLRGRQHLATPHTRSPWIPVWRVDTIQVAYSHIISHTCRPRLPWPPTISGAWKPQTHDGVDARNGTLYVPVPP